MNKSELKKFIRDSITESLASNKAIRTLSNKTLKESFYNSFDDTPEVKVIKELIEEIDPQRGKKFGEKFLDICLDCGLTAEDFVDIYDPSFRIYCPLISVQEDPEDLYKEERSFIRLLKDAGCKYEGVDTDEFVIVCSSDEFYKLKKLVERKSDLNEFEESLVKFVFPYTLAQIIDKHIPIDGKDLYVELAD